MLVKFETAPLLSCLWVGVTLLAATLVPALMSAATGMVRGLAQPGLGPMRGPALYGLGPYRSAATLPVLLIEGVAVVSEAAGTPLFGEEVEGMAAETEIAGTPFFVVVFEGVNAVLEWAAAFLFEDHADVKIRDTLESSYASVNSAIGNGVVHRG